MNRRAFQRALGGLPVWLLRRLETFDPSLVPILVWGGLRGGISVALALSMLLGLLAAAVPAWRASRLSVIDALRRLD